MPVAAVYKEKSIDQLIVRLYGDLPADQLKTIKAATLAANRHLTASTELKPGMIVAVPAPERAAVRARAAAPATDDSVSAIGIALKAYREELARKIDGSRDELDTMEKTFNSPNFRRAIDPIPEAKEFVKDIEAAIKDERMRIEETRRFVKEELEAAEKDLENLVGKVP